jgi:hypothetical protein
MPPELNGDGTLAGMPDFGGTAAGAPGATTGDPSGPSAQGGQPGIAAAGSANGSTDDPDPDDPAGGAVTSPTGGAGTGGTGSGGTAAWGPLTSTLSALGIRGPAFPAFGAVPTLVATTGTVAMAMAFGIFGKRRRDGEPPAPDEQLALAAAAGVGRGPAVTIEDEIEAAEALLPRWRRPSLLQARKADPIRDAVMPTARLTFDQGLVGPLNGHERRTIRYRVVRLLDAPDELRATETGYLDRGDEVQLLEKYGAYWLVLSPDGRQGWVHNMTLGDVIDEQVEPDRPVATMPLAAETWTMGESDDDNDVLEAYLESRRRER